MKERLLDFLVCPECKIPFELRINEKIGDEITEGFLACKECRQTFSVSKAIPRILLKGLNKEKSKTAENFGYGWKNFPKLMDYYEQQFLDWIYPVDMGFFRDKVMLDAGCGKGRHLIYASKFGAEEIIGIDLSSAVELAYSNTSHLPNVHIVQADLLHLPLKDNFFDYIYSIGVIHHLPDPEGGFKALLRHLKVGAYISIWVYGQENNDWIIKGINPLRKIVAANMPLPILKRLSWALTLILYGGLKSIYRPTNQYFKPLARHLFYNNYLFYISKFGFEEIHSIVFDHLLAPIANYHSKKEVQGWFNETSLKDVSINWHNNNSWRATARKVAL